MGEKRLRDIIGTWLPFFAYALLSIAVLAILLPKGYILTLDMAFRPSMDFTHFIYGMDEWWPPVNVPLWFILRITSQVIPSWPLQKIILFMILFIAGLGAHLLLPRRGASKYFVGLLYMVNPFVYVRSLAGQWINLAAYALLPFRKGFSGFDGKTR